MKPVGNIMMMLFLVPFFWVYLHESFTNFKLRGKIQRLHQENAELKAIPWGVICTPESFAVEHHNKMVICKPCPPGKVKRNDEIVPASVPPSVSVIAPNCKYPENREKNKERLREQRAWSEE